MKYRDRMNEKDFVISGTSPDGTLAELIELRDHPYFVGCQYHPEFQSKPNKPHPLFKGFIQACLAYQGDLGRGGSPNRPRAIEVNRPLPDALSSRSLIAAPSP